jgi:P4 family phage/plasmid primase-like protien
VRTIDELKKLLGNRAVLIPMEKGKKKPKHIGWQKTTLDDTLDDRYQRELEKGNIGVLVGRPSNGLCSIDIDNDDQVEPFLNLNPRLSDSLRTKGARGCNIWVQIKGDHPKGHTIKTTDEKKFGEWRADGMNTTIAGQHPDGHEYSFIIKSKPIQIHFDDIIWPDDLALPWIPSLEDQYGSPVLIDMKGKIKGVNEQFWAGLYARENIVVFDPAVSHFYRYDRFNGAYHHITSASIKTVIAERMLDHAEGELAALIEHRSDARLTAIVNVLKGIVEKRNIFDDRSPAIHLANCMIQITGQQIRKIGFSPSFNSRNQSPIIFDPRAECPRFLSELVLPAVHPDDVHILQKMMGQALLGKNPSQRFLILDGEGGRGKTQFVNVVSLLVGLMNCQQLRTDHLGDRFELFRVIGKTLLTGSDVPGDFMQTKGAVVLKSLVGGDFISPEGKNNNESFQIKGDFNVMITSNSRLKIRLEGDVSAWKRRLLIVRYAAPPPKKKIPNFAELLIEEEGSGILNWAIKGLIALMNDIDQTGDIRLTNRQNQIVDSLLTESDSLRYFLSNRIVKDSWHDLTVDEIKEAYAAFCPDMGWEPLPLTKIESQLGGLMLELFQTSKANSIQRNNKSARGFRGVTFNTNLP